MIWISFVTGGMTVLFAYALFSSGKEEEMEVLDPDGGLVVTEGSRRLFTIYCQNCRKNKKHREISDRIFQCTKCKRPTDVRIPS